VKGESLARGDYLAVRRAALVLREQEPAAYGLLVVCAFLATEPIPCGLFRGVRRVSTGCAEVPLEGDAELDVVADPSRLSRTLRAINRSGLATQDHRRDCVQLSPLAQLAVRDAVPVQDHARLRHVAHQLLADNDPGDPESVASWRWYDLMLPHAVASGVAECDDPAVRRLGLHLATVSHGRGDDHHAVEFAQQVHCHATTSLGETHPDVLTAGRQLSRYLRAAGCYEHAATILGRTVRQHRTSTDYEATFGAELELIAAQHLHGDWPAAHRASEEVLHGARSMFGDDDLITLKAAAVHAMSSRLTGHYRQALELDHVTVAGLMNLTGDVYTSTLNAIDAGILDARENGHHPRTRSDHETHATDAARCFGEHTPATLRRYADLAATRRHDGDYQGALDLSAWVLPPIRAACGETHPAVLAAAVGHSVNLRHAGQLDQARELGEEAFDIYRRVLGEHHPHTHAAAVNLATTLRRLGRASDARQVDERSFGHLRVRLGTDHPYAIVAGLHLATDLSATGDIEAARDLDLEMRDRARDKLGTDHPITLAATLNLSLDLRNCGRGTKAQALYSDIVDHHKKVFGENHPNTTAAIDQLRATCDIDPLPVGPP
jgi:hypothetical protein